MNRYFFAVALIAVVTLSAARANAAFSDPYLSRQVGSSPANGHVLQTDGTNSTWVDPSTFITGGSGNVATSSSEASGQIPYWTSTAGTPATLSGGSASFTFDGTKLTVTNINTTNLTFSSIANALLATNGAGTVVATTSIGVNLLTGILPIANGGTNNAASFSAGSVIYSDGTKLTEDNSNFFWNATTHRLGIGTSSPGTLLSIGGNGTGWNFVDNGTTTSSAKGINLANGGCFAIAGVCIGTGGNASSFAYPFPYNNNTGTTSGLLLVASTTIGAATQAAGLTINGGATTTLDSFFGSGAQSFGIRPSNSNTNTAGGYFRIDSSGNTVLEPGSSGILYFDYDHGTTNDISFLGDRVRFQGTTGNIGFGTTSPGFGISLGNKPLYLGAASAGGSETSANLFIHNLATAAGSFLAADPTGKIIATTTPSVAIDGGLVMSTTTSVAYPVLQATTTTSYPHYRVVLDTAGFATADMLGFYYNNDRGSNYGCESHWVVNGNWSFDNGNNNGTCAVNTVSTTSPSHYTFDIYNPSGARKMVNYTGGQFATGALKPYDGGGSAVWNNTGSQITNIEFYGIGAKNFSVGSTFSVYGFNE